MGFREGSYATVWEVVPKTPNVTQIRISTSSKPRGSEQYEQDFGEYCAVLGSAPAKEALSLKPKDRIKLGAVECRTHFDKEKQKKYYNFNIYTFEKVEPIPQAAPANEVIADDFAGPEDEGLPW